jgi:hypothetical protein
MAAAELSGASRQAGRSETRCAYDPVSSIAIFSLSLTDASSLPFLLREDDDAPMLT